MYFVSGGNVKWKVILFSFIYLYYFMPPEINNEIHKCHLFDNLICFWQASFVAMCTFTTEIFSMCPMHRLKLKALGWITESAVFSPLIDLICVCTCALSSALFMVWLCQSGLSGTSLIDRPKWISPGAKRLLPLCYICISCHYCSNSRKMQFCSVFLLQTLMGLHLH